MRLHSPAGRLVLALVVLAVIVLAISGRLGHGPTPTGSGAPAVAVGSSTPGATPGLPHSSSLDGASPAPPAPLASAAAAPTVRATQGASACQPTDQDAYVYNPGRLQVLASCTRVSGTVAAIRHETDGDLHILLALDPAYAGLLRPSNQGEELGDLVIEPVCVRSVTQLDAEAACAADPDPMSPPFPTVGEHVWMEGRYVLDLEHNGWAELHPLYRWGRV